VIQPYPLRTVPFLRDYLWGGRRLETVLNKRLPSEGVWAESWEVVDRPEHSSLVANGPLAGRSLREIRHSASDWLLGNDLMGQSLPLLFKYLDCQQVLSVQVHPDDPYALRMSPPDLGKTEAWYIMAAEPGSVLYTGLRSGVTRQDLVRAISVGNVQACLHEIHPQAGDCVFIPAGTVHALGAGLLVAEIQQSSNTTFRLFDWNCVDAQGRQWELHIAQSLEVIDFNTPARTVQVPVGTEQPARRRLVDCEKFVLDRIQAPKPNSCSVQIAGDARLHLLSVTSGAVRLTWDATSDVLATGESVVLPAAMPPLSAQFDRDSVMLDMYLPR
jgi:mannose-6-phosphate isomerase